MIIQTENAEEQVGVEDYKGRVRAAKCGFAEGTPEYASWLKGFAKAYLAHDAAIHLSNQDRGGGLEPV